MSNLQRPITRTPECRTQGVCRVSASRAFLPSALAATTRTERNARIATKATETEERQKALENPEQAAGLSDALKELPEDQQKQLAQVYQFLVQHPGSKVDLGSFQNLQSLFQQYQVLLWQPAELLNGRMAMIGFTAAVLNEYLTGRSVWQQLNYAPFAYLSAYTLVVLGAVLNRAFGSPSKGIGPFTRTAELWNGRMAMLGYVILSYVEYNMELRRAVLITAERLAQLQGISS